jgi:hypothetical protein
MVAPSMRLPPFFLVPLCAARGIARVSDDGLYEASIACEDREEEDVVNDEYGNGCTGSTRNQRIIGWIEQVIDCGKRVSEMSD